VNEVVTGTGGYLPWYGLPQFANESVIFISPNGLNNGWGNTGGADLEFIKSIIGKFKGDMCVDTTERFSTGFFYGAAMSYAIACGLGKQFRAVACLSGGPISGCEGGTDSVAYLGIHGISDQMLSITMGQSMRDRFVKNNGCTSMTPEEPAKGAGSHIKSDYKGCAEGKPVR
jgi:poly(3-hydroxybutyrate) depolymerase